jgi:hypothetical protein
MTKMTTTPKVSKSTFPENQPSQQEWFQQFGVASGYTKPTPYYGGNEFNTKVFLGQHRSTGGNLFGKFFNIITETFTWAN